MKPLFTNWQTLLNNLLHSHNEIHCSQSPRASSGNFSDKEYLGRIGSHFESIFRKNCTAYVFKTNNDNVEAILCWNFKVAFSSIHCNFIVITFFIHFLLVTRCMCNERIIIMWGEFTHLLDQSLAHAVSWNFWQIWRVLAALSLLRQLKYRVLEFEIK